MRGTANSLLSSNELVYIIKYPDPDSGTPGQPSSDANDQEAFGYDAQGALVWKKDQQLTEHFYVYDDRGRLTDDRVPTIGTNIDSAVKRVSRTYDALDRPVLVSSYDNATVGSGSVSNQVKYEYGAFSTVTNFWQAWSGAVNGSTPKVSYTYQYPANGTTGLRRTSTTLVSGKVINDLYSGTMNDTLSRVSGRADSVDGTIFDDSYLGLGRLVQRNYGAPYTVWTLVGSGGSNQDNYVGLDRFGRIAEIQLKNTFTGVLLNDYVYTYNNDSQVTVREDKVGTVAGSKEFSETWSYDGLRRLVNHKRGVYSGGSMTTIRREEAWTLDRSGNTTSYAVSLGGSPTTTTAAFNASNEMSQRNGSSTYASYNDAGDLTVEGESTGLSQIYDAWNRLTEVKLNGATLSQFRYNGLNRLIERPTGIQLYCYYGTEDQVLEEWSVFYNTVYNWYCWGTQYIDDLVIFSPNSATYNFVFQDANFNVTTRVDLSGSVLNRFVYENYGQPKKLSADWSTWQAIIDDMPGFTGRHYQKDQGRYYYRNRTLDPDLMAFLERGPMGMVFSRRWFGNLHALSKNDPVNSRLPGRSGSPSLTTRGVSTATDSAIASVNFSGILGSIAEFSIAEPFNFDPYPVLPLYSCSGSGGGSVSATGVGKVAYDPVPIAEERAVADNQAFKKACKDAKEKMKAEVQGRCDAGTCPTGQSCKAGVNDEDCPCDFREDCKLEDSDLDDEFDTDVCTTNATGVGYCRCKKNKK